HRSDHRKSFRLGLSRRDREQINVLEEAELGLALQSAVVMKLARESPFMHLPFDLAQITIVFGREIARDFKTRRREIIALAQQAIGLGQLAQALLRRDAREIADGEIAVLARAERRVDSL